MPLQVFQEEVMRIIMFMARWCKKCTIFKDVDYDVKLDIDLPSNNNTLLKYQISIIPTFVAISDGNRVLGKLSNPNTVEDFNKWKAIIEKKGK